MFCFHPTWGLGLGTAGGNAEPPLTLGSRELSSGTSTSPGELLLASLLGALRQGEMNKLQEHKARTGTEGAMMRTVSHNLHIA